MKYRKTMLMKERAECKDCHWFSTNLAWWDMLAIDLEERRHVIGMCIRPRDNYLDYPIIEVPECKVHCKHFEQETKNNPPEIKWK